MAQNGHMEPNCPDEELTEAQRAVLRERLDNLAHHEGEAIDARQAIKEGRTRLKHMQSK